MKKWFAISFIIFLTLGIFSFSLQDAETSTQLSVSLTQALVGEVSSEPSATVLSLNHVIREFAHIIEYFILSFCTISMFCFLKYRLRAASLITSFYIFIISILDELIQYSLSPGRAFQLIDLLKDWLGMGIGIFCFWIVYKTYNCMRFKLINS